MRDSGFRRDVNENWAILEFYATKNGIPIPKIPDSV
jgi:hypothetical protein